MRLDDPLYDIHVLEEEMRTFERKYGVTTETFVEAYDNGEEPANDDWVQDWAAWASAYKIWKRRQAAEFFETADRLQALDIPPLSEAEIAAARAERRAPGASRR